jgi:hypothetical protein
LDTTAHYRYLASQGRDEFLGAEAPGALVRYRDGGEAGTGLDESTMTVEHSAESIDMPYVDGEELEIHPLAKKPGASFPDRITIGRTSNNDIALNEHSVSRLHAYLKFDGQRWLVADAGSKNGTWLDGLRLDPRREMSIRSRSLVRIGDIELTFYNANDLFALLGGG